MRSEIPRQLEWAKPAHENGLRFRSFQLSHKHSAYIVEQADTPGFSRREQPDRPSDHGAQGLVGQDGGAAERAAGLLAGSAALRTAVLFSRSQRPVITEPPAAERRPHSYPDRGRRLASQHAADRRGANGKKPHGRLA